MSASSKPDAPDQGAGGRAAGGALGPELAAALRDYHAALSRLGRAEATLETARREASESRARLQALTTGARLSSTRVLVAVDHDGAEQADEQRGSDQGPAGSASQDGSAGQDASANQDGSAGDDDRRRT